MSELISSPDISRPLSTPGDFQRERQALKTEFLNTPTNQRSNFVQEHTQHLLNLVYGEEEIILPMVLEALFPKDLEVQEKLREKAKPSFKLVLDQLGHYSSLNLDGITQGAYFLPDRLFNRYAAIIEMPKFVSMAIVDIAYCNGSGVVVYKAEKFKKALKKGLSRQKQYELVHSTIHTLQKVPPCPIGLTEPSADWYASEIIPGVRRLKYPQRDFKKMVLLIGKKSMEKLIFGGTTLEETIQELKPKDKEWIERRCAGLNVVQFGLLLREGRPIPAFIKNSLSSR